MPRFGYVIVACVSLGVGAIAIVMAPTNNALDGWGMLLRSVGGQALVVFGVECASRSRRARVPGRARRVALLVSSLLLLPVSAVFLLMSKEGGSSWGLASLLLCVWYAAVAVYAALALAFAPRARRG